MRRAQRYMWVGLAVGLAAFTLIAADEQFQGFIFHLDGLINNGITALDGQGLPVHLAGAVLSLIGDARTVTAAAAVAVLWMVVRKEWRLGVWAAGIAIAVSLVGDGLKLLFHRSRPPVALLSSYSFPSGHTIGATATLGALLILATETYERRHHDRPRREIRLWRRILVLWAVLAFLTGLGRILSQQHWFGDVAASWSLGLALVSGMLLVLTKTPLGRDPGPTPPRAAAVAADSKPPAP